MDRPDLQRLAKYVATRRAQLNLSIKRATVLADLGSKDTWIRVEAGKPAQLMSYGKIETALGWAVGSCRRVVDGGEPILRDEAGVEEVEFAEVPPADLEDRYRRAIQGAMVAGTNMTADRIRTTTELAIDAIRKEGLLPSED